MNPPTKVLRVAFLIDADNVSIDVIQQAFELVGMRHELIHVRRAYCTAESALKHMQLFKRLSIRPIVNISTGKNSTDIALAVDAIDMVTAERPDVVYIVSSDSDFAPLVIRLREKGCRVEGIGQKGKTGEESVIVYDDFVDIEHRRGLASSHRGGPPVQAPGRSNNNGPVGKRSRRGGRGRVDRPERSEPQPRSTPRLIAPPMPEPARFEAIEEDLRDDAFDDRPYEPPHEREDEPADIREGDDEGVAAELPTIDETVEPDALAPAPPSAPTRSSGTGRTRLPRSSRAKSARAEREAVAEATATTLHEPAASEEVVVEPRAVDPAVEPAAEPAEPAARAEPAAAAPSRRRAKKTGAAAGDAKPAAKAPAKRAARGAAKAAKTEVMDTPLLDAVEAPVAASVPETAPKPVPKAAPVAASAPTPVAIPDLSAWPDLPPEIATILATVPALASGEPVELGVAGERLRAAGLLAKSAPSTRLFGRHPEYFVLTPIRQPNKVRFKTGE